MLAIVLSAMTGVIVLVAIVAVVAFWAICQAEHLRELHNAESR